MTASLQRNLPAHFYVDPGVHDAERQAIFRRTWQLLGPESQVAAPGDYLAVELAGWHLFVLRGRDGVLRGFHNLCRHRGARLLAEGQGRCSLLRCPYHNWVYDQEGRLQKAPWFGEHPDFRLEDWPLKPVSVASWRGLLFLAIAPEQELVEQLGDLPEELADHPLESFTAVATRRFVMAANWKTYTDNFVEQTIEGNCAIVEEDFGICEETQRNYASGAYSPGPLSPRHEPGVAYFQQRVQASLAPEEQAAQ
ncbi:aromatic ring-hydroxylating oxygenase subunit alpha [Aquibaculum sediminis]|uniref:aromatic ring-hydroxylating oxygenase subunit alpha n=1 Tax=Aquibaculum sediminis TaxID=3231907 RepID=UPI003456BF29